MAAHNVTVADKLNAHNMNVNNSMEAQYVDGAGTQCILIENAVFNNCNQQQKNSYKQY